MQETRIEKNNEEKRDSEIEKVLKEKVASYLLAAFGLVAGLAWNEAVKALIEYVFPAKGNTLIAKFAYALGLTIVLALVSVYITRIFKKEEAK